MNCTTHHEACKCREAMHAALDKRLNDLRRLAEVQACDFGLWFDARTAPEAYLQHQLRKLHAMIEADL